jgi:flagellar hook-basal body complex protein FliE
MSTTIFPIGAQRFPAIESLPSLQPPGFPKGDSASTRFSDVLSSSIATVEQASHNATSATQQFLSGENEDLHTVAIAEQKAEIATELFMQVRNKAISA